MPPRSLAGAVQLAVFLGGGVVCPAGHLARHDAEHSHGATERAQASRHAHPHPHRHLHPAARAHAHAHAHAHDRPRPEPDAAGEVPVVPDGADHGRGSLAHLDLTLLAGVLALPLPLARPAGLVPLAPRARVASLFQPSFPLPRPPPPSPSS